jgi:nucleotide-binding universal stress UspA family protein
MKDEWDSDVEGIVVVGYDGSAAAGAAVDWAATEAWRRGTALLVSTVCEPRHAAEAAMGRPGGEVQAARWIAEQGAGRAGVLYPALRTLVSTPFRGPADALVEEARGAAMLVVGATGHGNLVGTVFGSVAFAVIAHATCPVVVVRGDSTLQPGPDGPVVLGLDSSGTCSAATDLAARTAASSGAPLVLVNAWQPALQVAYAWSGTGGADPDADELISATAFGVLLHTVATDVLRSYPELLVRVRPLEGPPVQTLATAAEHAALLVVGTRGRGGFAAMLLGSISRGLTLAAPCPVAVVRGPAT